MVDTARLNDFPAVIKDLEIMRVQMCLVLQTRKRLYYIVFLIQNHICTGLQLIIFRHLGVRQMRTPLVIDRAEVLSTHRLLGFRLLVAVPNEILVV